MTPPALRLSDVRCKCCPYRRCHGSRNERTDNEGVCVVCCI